MTEKPQKDKPKYLTLALSLEFEKKLKAIAANFGSDKTQAIRFLINEKYEAITKK